MFFSPSTSVRLNIIPELISYIFYNFGLPKFIDNKIKTKFFSIKLNILEINYLVINTR